MSTDTAVSLAGQHQALREQLQQQRRMLAHALAAGGGYPRSATMRWLMREPELAGKVVGQIAGGSRAAAALPAVFLLVRLLRSVILLR